MKKLVKFYMKYGMVKRISFSLKIKMKLLSY